MEKIYADSAGRWSDLDNSERLRMLAGVSKKPAGYVCSAGGVDQEALNIRSAMRNEVMAVLDPVTTGHNIQLHLQLHSNSIQLQLLELRHETSNRRTEPHSSTSVFATD